MKTINLFQKTHLPKDGWFQGCVLCGVVTGHREYVSFYRLGSTYLPYCNKYNFYSFTCKDCCFHMRRKRKWRNDFVEESRNMVDIYLKRRKSRK